MSNDRVLLLLHGALGASAQFGALGTALSKFFRVHTLDFEGHGTEPPRSRPFRMEHFAENIIETLDRANVEQADVFGYSMGGYVALHIAAQGSSRIARIATLGTKFQWDPATAAREAARLDPRTIRAKVPRFADLLAARHEQAGGWENLLANTAELLRELGEHPILDEPALARITQPVRVIVGDRDNTVTVEESATAARKLPAGELAVLPRTSHPIEQVDL